MKLPNETVDLIEGDTPFEDCSHMSDYELSEASQDGDIDAMLEFALRNER